MSDEFFSMREIVKQYVVGGEVQTILKGHQSTSGRGSFSRTSGHRAVASRH